MLLAAKILIFVPYLPINKVDVRGVGQICCLGTRYNSDAGQVLKRFDGFVDFFSHARWR